MAVEDAAALSAPPAGDTAPPHRVSVLERFLQVRGIERKKPLAVDATKPPAVAGRAIPPRGPAAAATLARLPQRTMWHAYTKRLHGARTQFAREAMRVPDDSYSDSADVYNPKKRSMAILKVHEDADDVNRQFLYRARRLVFEREVVDRPVCDLEENQAWYDEALDRVYAESDDDCCDGADCSSDARMDPATDPPHDGPH